MRTPCPLSCLVGCEQRLFFAEGEGGGEAREEDGRVRLYTELWYVWSEVVTAAADLPILRSKSRAVDGTVYLLPLPRGRGL